MEQVLIFLKDFLTKSHFFTRADL